MRLTAPRGTMCPRCDQVHQRCAGHNRSGAPCGNHPAAGLEVCGLHGALAPRAVAVTEHFLAEQQAVASLAEVGVVPIGNPLEELGHVAAEMRALQRHVANKVAELTSWTGPNHLGDETFSVWVPMLRQLYADVAKLLADWVRLGFDERMVALHEHQTDLVERYVLAVVADLELTDVQRAAVPDAAVRHLSLLTGGRAAA